MKNTGKRLYTVPEIYDAAFSWDPGVEKEFYSMLLTKYANLESTSCLVEFGSGTGRILRALDLDCFSLGLDVSLEMTRFGRKKTSRRKIDFVVADMANVPAKTGSFAAALCLLSSINYLRPMKAVEQHLREASRILTKDGVYIIDFLQGIPEKTEEEWETIHDGTRYAVRWSIKTKPRRPDEFQEDISIRSQNRLLARGASSIARIRSEAFQVASTNAGFRSIHRFKPFSKTTLEDEPPDGRIVVALTKQPSPSLR